ncbi:unnamed protein product [Protopolystoma xenopodis]|uniref:Uncharacterized protein n=1 Tax=Protopolystoma xenopodis TaxID=117903 RepID=A0A3S5BNF5_9PLAT|nr:unnamed protein product [Protopolystoma xenopodis]
MTRAGVQPGLWLLEKPWNTWKMRFIWLHKVILGVAVICMGEEVVDRTMRQEGEEKEEGVTKNDSLDLHKVGLQLLRM